MDADITVSPWVGPRGLSCWPSPSSSCIPNGDLWWVDVCAKLLALSPNALLLCNPTPSARCGACVKFILIKCNTIPFFLINVLKCSCDNSTRSLHFDVRALSPLPAFLTCCVPVASYPSVMLCLKHVLFINNTFHSRLPRSLSINLFNVLARCATKPCNEPYSTKNNAVQSSPCLAQSATFIAMYSYSIIISFCLTSTLPPPK